MGDSYDYIVIGLGGLGSSTAYWLSRREGAKVLGMEQFELDHVRGESQDHSRIIRLTYHAPEYVRYAQQAYDAWDTLEAESGRQVVVKTGEVNFWPVETSLNRCDYADAMDACGVPYEDLDYREVMRRFPQFSLDDTIETVYQPDGGLVGAIVANETHRAMAQQNGAVLLDNHPITNVRQVNGGYEVTAGGRTFGTEKLAIAAGPWTNRVLSHFGLSLPLKVTHEQVSYFASPNLDEFSPDRFPVWIWMILDNFYGFPVYGAPGVKAAKDRFDEVDADERGFDPDPGNENEVRGFMEKYIPRGAGPLLYTKTCLLTHTPDIDFVIDRIPGHPNCVVTVGAAHAFKFASVIGQTLSELLVDGRTDKDIAAFRINRPALQSPGRFVGLI